MNDLEQLRAKDALAKISELANGTENYGKYVSYVKALPIAILQNGLGQALASEFSNSSKDNGHKFLFEHICHWLGRNNPLAPYQNTASGEALLEAIMDGSQQQYIQAQHEAVEYLAWLKKFAVALLEQEEETTNV